MLDSYFSYADTGNSRNQKRCVFIMFSLWKMQKKSSFKYTIHFAELHRLNSIFWGEETLVAILYFIITVIQLETIDLFKFIVYSLSYMNWRKSK